MDFSQCEKTNHRYKKDEYKKLDWQTGEEEEKKKDLLFA